ncbi:MAG TPA: glycoside hydrolase family 38 C-terminal domain-containing protein, partial [Bacteroidales bacterium]|nr:glycoside hydrolase family 38 C-terminal domain-containing protein [Bacteroidales bacterium]
FEESIEIEPVALLSKDNRQTINVTATHFGNDKPLTLVVDGKENYRFILKPGMNNFEIYHDAVQAETPLHIKAILPDQADREFSLVLMPVKFREIHLIHHSHYDVGYSDRQQAVEQIQNRNIVNALRYIRQTSNLPREAQFKWNIETTMAIENFLNVCTPVQKDELMKAVREGNIGIGGLYAGITTGLCQPEELYRLTMYAQKLENEFGIRIPAAMITDIPGLTWGTIPALARNGIRYFSDGPNYVASYPDGGDRVGHSNNNWSDKPFWWVSPSGEEKILFWMAGRGYSSWHGMKPGDIAERGKKKIAAYMAELDAKGYPYEMVQWRYSIVADNGPTDSLVSHFVADWNSRYNSPKIVLSTIDGMFREFELRYGDQLPAFTGDFSPYWEDGAYSTAAEMAMNRVNSEKLTQLSNVYAITGRFGYLADDIEQAWEKVLLFDEHTWGAYNSISDPDIPFVTDQWRFKRQYALDADAQVKKLGKPIRLAANTLQFDVINTLSWPRTDVVYLDAVTAGDANTVLDDAGNEVLCQMLSDGRLAFMATAVPALGSKRYSLINKGTLAQSKAFNTGTEKLENEFFSLKIDRSTGNISSMVWKPLNAELVKTGSNEGLNKFLYVPGRDPKTAVTSGQPIEVRLKENGPLLAVLQVKSDAPGCNSLLREIIIYKGLNRLELSNTVDKKAVREKESVHFAFPFGIRDAVSRFNTGWGGIFSPGVNQLAGSNQDYYCVQHWCDVSNQEYGVSLLLREACLVEPGEMVDEQQGKYGMKEWKTKPNTDPTLYSYVMNNYWHTNFKADQEGPVTFTYALVPHGLFNVAETQRQGLSFNQPLLAIPATGDVAGSLFTLDNNAVIATSIAAKGDGLFVRFFNSGAAPVSFKIVPGTFAAGVVKVRETDGSYSNQPEGQKFNLPGFGILEVVLVK